MKIRPFLGQSNDFDESERVLTGAQFISALVDPETGPLFVIFGRDDVDVRLQPKHVSARLVLTQAQADGFKAYVGLYPAQGGDRPLLNSSRRWNDSKG